MFYLIRGSKFTKTDYKYSVVGKFESLSEAVWNFYDYMKSCVSVAGNFYDDMELHLSEDPIIDFHHSFLLLSAFNGSSGKSVVRDNIDEYYQKNFWSKYEKCK